MNTKHTPDEWTIPSHVAGPDIPIIAGSRAIALVVNDEDEPIGDAEQLANARLMAAAPRLLEALRYMVANAEADGWSGMMLADATAAIAEAGGRA